MSYLKKAVDILGGQNKTARILSVSQPTVHYWLNESENGIPAEYCAKMEEATLGRIKREQLRPDLFGKQPAAVK